MRPRADHAIGWRVCHVCHACGVAGALLVAGSVVFAEDARKVDNPHGRLREECSVCHDARGWTPAHVGRRFDHARYGFALTGAHATSDCMSCHATLRFSDAKTLCADCHKDPHRGELGIDCARCHGARSFVDRAPMVRAHQITNFPLTGAHASVDCESCHPGAAQGRLQYVGTPTDCGSCHMPQYDSAKDPDHVAAAYPLACQECHSMTTWTASGFDHSRTGFPLTGAHVTVACVRCHPGSRFAGTPTDCASCHMTQYDGATPNHVTAGFPASACSGCHNTTTWAGTVFNHDDGVFPLTGAHAGAGVTCAECHSDGVYQGKPADCLSCHTTQFNSATPTHTTTWFPDAQCGTCHNTTAWTGGRMGAHDGSWFPIYSGSHNGRWSACTDCHGSSDYSQFTCTTPACHPQTTTDSRHSGVRNYSYSSPACYSCHPRGSSG